jgi:hypothetical protein
MPSARQIVGTETIATSATVVVAHVRPRPRATRSRVEISRVRVAIATVRRDGARARVRGDREASEGARRRRGVGGLASYAMHTTVARFNSFPTHRSRSRV